MGYLAPVRSAGVVALRILTVSLTMFVVACFNEGPGESDDVGVASLELRDVPDSVRCIRIDVSAAQRSLSEEFGVTPGTEAVLTLRHLPVGDVTFIGEAFSVSCDAVEMSDSGDWSSAPVTVTIERGQTARVILLMKPNARAQVEVRFEEGPAMCMDPLVEPCGNCGFRRGVCDSSTGEVVHWSACMDQGVCAPGEVAYCGAAGTRTCTQQCDWGECDCPPGLTRCGDECFDLATGAEHCGSCTNVCFAGQVCNAGQCQCPRDLHPCGDRCVDTRSDHDACGSCDVVCAIDEACVQGACVLICPPGTVVCGDSCVDLASNNAHCGACGAGCVDGTRCQAGVCQCSAPLVLCHGVCVDIRRDVSHCGGCDVVCGAGSACHDGLCMP